MWGALSDEFGQVDTVLITGRTSDFKQKAMEVTGAKDILMHFQIITC